MEIQEMIEVLSKAKKNEKGEYINVECRSKRDIDDNWGVASNPIWDFADLDYRIKPEPKRVPLTKEDLIERIKNNQTIAIIHRNLDDIYTWAYIAEGGIKYNGFSNIINFSELMKETFADGTPCSKESECE